MPNKRGKNRSPFLPDWGRVKFTPSFRIKRELTTFPLSSFRKHFHYEQTQHKEDYQKAIYVLCRLSCLRFSFRVLTLTNNIEIRIIKIGKISNKVSKVVCNQNKLLQGIKIIICRISFVGLNWHGSLNVCLSLCLLLSASLFFILLAIYFSFLKAELEPGGWATTYVGTFINFYKQKINK